jgi:hypothetical protein
MLAAACGDRPADPDTSLRIARIDQQRLRQHVERITAFGPRSRADLHATRSTVEYIRRELVAYGYRPELRPVATEAHGPGSDYGFENILAERRSNSAGAGILEIGAHYDTVPGTPGADDNASGVAALLEIARVLADARPRHKLRFCWFALEEDGRDGSRAHVRRLREQHEPLLAAFIFEMIGFTSNAPGSQATPLRVPLLFSPPRRGNFITVVGNWRSGAVGNRFESAARRYTPGLRYFSVNRLGGLFRDALRSDHKPYWDAGYAAVMLTDTADFRNPNYHRAADRVNTLDFAFMAQVARATAATVLDWDNNRSYFY